MTNIAIIGLGNHPGGKYDLTRHNIGKLLLRQYVDNKGGVFQRKKQFPGSTANLGDVIVFYPHTFMNCCGNAIARFLNFYKDIERVIIIHDDLDIEFGRLKQSVSRTTGGHNGLKDIFRYISKPIERLRIGISHPRNRNIDPSVPNNDKIIKGHNTPVSDYVLQRFYDDELESIRRNIPSVIEMIDNIQKMPATLFSNKWHGLTMFD
ncbi:aminoacyl-tRNA hydrolase [Chlamydiia bacterium]|nr:aminoacyl-tRNA hydrolase [Chlamydiia bacterium]